jgi:hypothetical protein
MYVGGHIGGGQYGIRIRNPRFDNREWFTFDKKTGHIRWAANKRYALASQKGRQIKLSNLVVRIAKNTPLQKFKFNGNNKPHSFHSKSNMKMCFDIYGGRNTENNKVVMYNCHNGWNQRWSIAYHQRRVSGKTNGWIPDRLFTIRSKSGRGLFVSNDGTQLLPSERYVKFGPYRTSDEYKFYYDAKTQQIRSFLYKGYVLTSRKQGTTQVLIAYGPGSTHAGRNPEIFQRLGKTHIIDKSNKLAIQPVNNDGSNEMYAVLEKDNEKSKYQAFTVRYLQSNASRRRPRQKQRSIVRLHGSGSHGSWGFAENRVFSLKARYSNKVAYIDSKDKNAIKMRSPKRTSDEKFFFDRNTGLIHSAKDSKLAVEMIPAAKGEYKLAAVSFSGKEKD